jgi:hypothetical protein
MNVKSGGSWVVGRIMLLGALSIGVLATAPGVAGAATNKREHRPCSSSAPRAARVARW